MDADPPARPIILPWLLTVTMLLLPGPVARGSDGGPSRCIARWRGPAEGCALQESVSAEGLGRNERAAHKQALRNLATAAEAARNHKAASLPAGARSLFLDASPSCDEGVEQQAIVTCFPEPHLSAARYCWLEIDLDLCSQSQGFFLTGKPWTEGEQQRASICGALPEAAFDEEPLGEREASCQASCWQKGRLSCGASRR